jgi:hypothetical protein
MKPLICAFLFLLSVALPGQTTTTSPQTSSRYKDGTIAYAFKANGFFLQLPYYYAANTINAYGVDYSFYVKCNRAALFAGYTPLYGFNTGSPNTSQLNCMNYGVQFKLTKPNKASAFYLCFYDLYNRQSYHGLAPQKTNLININPKYQLLFLKNIFSLELGIITGFTVRNSGYGSHVFNFHHGSSNLTPQYGFNVSLAFNFSTFFK